MLSCRTMGILLVVHAATILASQTDAFIPILTYSKFQKMQERERSKGQKKLLHLQQRSEEEETSEEEENFTVQLTAPVEIGMKMNSRQLEKYPAALEGLLREALPPTQPGKLSTHPHCSGRASPCLRSLSILMLIF
ncbi:promotilin [Thomomys bottae]